MAAMIRKVGVIGSGQMGNGIAHVAALAGFDVVLNDLSADHLKSAMATINGNLSRQVSKKIITEDARKKALERIASTETLDGLADCDLVIETAVEKEEVKRKIFHDLCAVLKSEAIIASNTSSISITRLAASTDRPEKFIGIHFMNPVPLMELVELIRGIATGDATFDAAKEFVTRLGKQIAVSEDFPAFIVNRILHAECGHPVLLRGQEPDRREPGRQRRPRPVEDRSRGDRRAPPAGPAHPQPGTGAPELSGFALRAHEPVGPAQSGQVVQAGLVVREPLQQLLVGGRVIHSPNRIRGHPQILLHPSRYAEQVFYWGMDGAAAVRSHPSTDLAQASDAVVDLDRLATLYRSRVETRVPVRQRDLQRLERTLRKHVAEAVLTQVLPALVGELVEAVADDLTTAQDGQSRTELEALADADLRVVESVERCKAVLDAVALEAMARLRSTIEADELARFADLDQPRPAGWIDPDQLTAMEVCTATLPTPVETPHRRSAEFAESRGPGWRLCRSVGTTSASLCYFRLSRPDTSWCTTCSQAGHGSRERPRNLRNVMRTSRPSQSGQGQTR